MEGKQARAMREKSNAMGKRDGIEKSEQKAAEGKSAKAMKGSAKEKCGNSAVCGFGGGELGHGRRIGTFAATSRLQQGAR